MSHPDLRKCQGAPAAASARRGTPSMANLKRSFLFFGGVHSWRRMGISPRLDPKCCLEILEMALVPDGTLQMLRCDEGRSLPFN
jgi:hypothetical protein